MHTITKTSSYRHRGFRNSTGDILEIFGQEDAPAGMESAWDNWVTESSTTTLYTPAIEAGTVADPTQG